jgi:oxygen-independent coproporphyrinogen-3 oxidase
MCPDPFKQKQEPVGPTGRALYVHVPFCRSKCRYCGFSSVPLDGPGPAEAFVQAVLVELEQRRDQLALPVETIYVGGGTPTVLPAALLAELLEALAARLGPGGEFTIEANPATVEPDLAGRLVDAGVNRVSLGAQSFRDAELAWLGRIHRSARTARTVDALTSAGIANIGLDLIYGLPGQTVEQFGTSLTAAAALPIAHVSCYALSYDPPSPLWADLQAGRVEPLADEIQERMYRRAREILQGQGLEQYELSNFARLGMASRHNQVYWRNEAYVGLGPAAASYLAGLRSTNTTDLAAYFDRIGRSQPATAESERLTGRAAMAEALMLALRLCAGVDRGGFARRWGADPAEAFARSVDKHVRGGALSLDRRVLRLHPEAYFTADTVLADILAEA